MITIAPAVTGELAGIIIFHEIMMVKKRQKKQYPVESRGVPGDAEEFGALRNRRRGEDDQINFLASIIQNIPDAVCSIDLEGNILTWNRGAEKMLGFKVGEILGKNIMTIIPEELGPREMEHCITALNSDGFLSGYETERIAKDGRRISVELTAVALKDKNNRFKRYASIMRDVTDRRRAEEELKSSHERLTNLTAHLQRVREEERTGIAREIHDELGQALTALKMDLAWLKKRLPGDEKALLEKSQAMSKLIDATIGTVKRISAELRPGLLDDLGLVAAIEWQTREFLNRTGIECELAVSPGEIILDKDRSLALFRIFQEALTNVARHANATEVKIRVEKRAGKVVLKVKDNGKGLSRKQVIDPQSFGLIGMRERARSYGGEVTIRGVKGKGTAITVVFPSVERG